MGTIIRNLGELLEEREGEAAGLWRDALEAAEKAIEEVMPENALKRVLRIRGHVLRVGGFRVNLRRFERVIVLGAGKASVGMAEYVEKVLGDRVSGGVVVAPREKLEKRLKKIEVLPSTHPIPSMLGVRASDKLLEYAEKADEKTLVIFLLSGGASALLPLPAPPLNLEDKAETTRLLLKSGATIDEVNTVRRHLSEVKGGRLVKKMRGATVISLIISDVVGDKLETIGSGPTAPDPTTFKDAYEVLKRYGLWEKVPESVRRRIEDGVKGVVEDNPKPGDPLFSRVHNIIIASISDACEAARLHLRKKGYRAEILTRYMEGEASGVGRFAAGILREVTRGGGRKAIVAGGETTVTVRGHGVGGRNQELALSASIALSGLKRCCLLCMGTDGVDGPTDAAGAIVDGETYGKAVEKGVNPTLYLADNNSYSFFKRVGGHIITGPTGTNVGDLLILIHAH